jgi:hypothetical protein
MYPITVYCISIAGNVTQVFKSEHLNLVQFDIAWERCDVVTFNDLFKR